MLELKNFSAFTSTSCLYDSLHLQVEPGDVVRVVGPNGAGKSTLLKQIAQLSFIKPGDIQWKGAHFQAHYSLVYLDHKLGFFQDSTVLEVLQLYQRLYQVNLSDDSLSSSLSRWGLDELLNVPVHHLSRGMQQKLALTRFDLCQRPLWLMDEPATALDPLAVKSLAEMISQASDAGVSIIFTSHQCLSPLPQYRELNLKDFPMLPRRSQDAIQWED